MEEREGYLNSRGYNYAEEDIAEVIKQAMYQGLTSFRNKGIVKLKYKDDDGYISFMLVTLDDSNILTIVTILDSARKDDYFTSYVKVQNNINLVQYFTLERKYELKIITKPTNTVRPGIRKVTHKRQHTKPTPVTQNEIDEFLQSMK